MQNPMQVPKSHSYVTVVPAYQATLAASEAFALTQLKRLAVHNITLVCPTRLEVAAYLELVPDLQVIRLPGDYFTSVQSCNTLMLQPWFYELFTYDYEWMMVHQLDAFLLSNQINDFCELSYHYFGAP